MHLFLITSKFESNSVQFNNTTTRSGKCVVDLGILVHYIDTNAVHVGAMKFYGKD